MYAEIKIIGSSNITEEVLTKNEVKSIYLGRKRLWSNNQKIILTILVKSKTQSDFHTEYLGIDLTKFVNYWRIKVYKGQGYFPKIFNTEEEMIAYIAEHKNAIGYISDLNNSETVKEFIIKE